MNDGLPRPLVSRILSDEGALGQTDCSLLYILDEHFARQREDGGEWRSRLFEVSQRVANGDGRGEPIRLGYLIQAIERQGHDQRRRQLGRMRCGNCQHYGSVSRRCLYRASPYLNELAPSTDPRSLDPACESYSSRRGPHPLDPQLAAPDPEPSAAELVARALEISRRADPLGTELVVEADLDGTSLRQLERHLGIDRRRLAAIRRRTLARLGCILEDLT